MTIVFTNTLGGRKERFEAANPLRVGVYVCGPTVYDSTHVGHARAAVVFDVLRRHLAWRGYEMLFVQNVTDVDDKIINRAHDLGVDPAIVAERYTREYDEAMRALGVIPPDIAPRASGHVTEMIDLISKLADDGYAYPVNGSVYFAVEKFAEYGKLSRQRIDDLRAGDRVAAEPGTLSPLDFAVWKAAKPGEPSWPSPFGPGRPGWHIECSAMALKYLGMPFDIHGGGSDLIFPHHENEIAQSEAACGTSPFARYWLHNGHVQIGGESMSKSLRNYVVVQEALQDYAPQVMRLFILGAHYRSPVSYGPEVLDEAKAVWSRFEAFLRAAPEGGRVRSGALDEFGAAMDDDLNTPRAVAALHGIVSAGNHAIDKRDGTAAGDARAALLEGLGVLGCDQATRTTQRDALGPLVEFLLELREQARAGKDYAQADRIRERLTDAGIRVEDTPQGARWFIES